MIEITIGELINSQSTFRELATMPIRLKTSFAIARIIREVEAEMNIFEQSRQVLLDKYSVKDENGQPKTTDDGNIMIQTDLIDNYNKDVQELLAEKITLNANPIRLEELENLELTPSQVYMIEGFIEE